MMRGPDFELPPLDPPAPAPTEVPGDATEGAKRLVARQVAGAAVVVLLGLAGSGVYAWHWGGGAAPTPPATVDSPLSTAGTIAMPPSSVAPPTTRAATVTRTCLDSPEDPGAARDSPPERPPWLTVNFSPRVTGETLALIVRAATDAHDAFGAAGAVVVNVDCDMDEYAEATGTSVEEARENVSQGRIAHIRGANVVIYGPSFQRLSLARRRQAVYHEYFHAVQHFLSANRSARVGVDRPLWLIEGSARFFENAVTPRELDIFRQSEVKRRESLPLLADLEHLDAPRVPGASGDAYTLGSIASDYLVATYGRDRLQHDLWVAFSATDWRSAFRQVFGVTVDSFYADFEAYRSTLRP